MKKTLKGAWKKTALFFLPSSLLVTSALAEEAPNIVLILCDDLGYGEIQSLNPKHGKILTPCVDKIAAEGMIFTDAHSGSSVCTPTRYGLLTGRYSWRTELQQGVVQGYQPNLIAKDRLTVASFLKAQGYHTGIIGKWHLNFLYLDAVTKKPLKRKSKRTYLAPVGSIIPDGPLTRGFDYFHGFHHSGDMEGVIENKNVIAHDNVVNMLPRITHQAVAYIERRSADKKPFFLYVPYGSPHSPIVPTREWQGRSGLNPHADFVMQTDDGVGQIMKALDKHDLTQNTLVIFSSDNGTSKKAKIDQLTKMGHHSSAGFRGSKADLWDGGHRVPFIVRWPEKVKPSSQSNETICLTDLIATCAEITKSKLPDNTAEDSVSFLPFLLEREMKSTRKGIIHHSISGHFGYRQGKWKLLLAQGSGGWSSPTEHEVPQNSPKGQLYDMENDPAEKNNLFSARPQIVSHLLSQLKKDITSGRSTNGSVSPNDTQHIILWKTSQKQTSPRKSKLSK